MLTALDHIVLICPSLDAAIETYTTLLGRSCDWRAQDDEAGTETALFQVAGGAIELLAPTKSGPAADKIRDMLAKTGPRLTSLAYRTDSIEDCHAQLLRRGLQPGDISSGQSQHHASSDRRTWQRFRCADPVMAGIKSFVLEHRSPLLDPQQCPPSSVSGMDHVVIQTPNPDRATAIYGARLGIRLALDRTFKDWKTRLLFFKLGGLTIEIAHRVDPETDPSLPDQLWGISWIVPDLEAAHERLSKAAVEVSDIRTGRKPGTRVFTVKSGTLGVATLFIEHLGS